MTIACRLTIPIFKDLVKNSLNAVVFETNMSKQNIRKEVMKTLERNIDTYVDKFLIPAEKIWQPTDFLPNSQKDSFIDEIKEIQELSKAGNRSVWFSPTDPQYWMLKKTVFKQLCKLLPKHLNMSKVILL